VSSALSSWPSALAGLTRRRADGVVGGVCAGLARSARVDAALVRLVFAFTSFAGAAGLVAYAGCWLALPDEDAASAPGRVRRLTGLLLLAVSPLLALRAVGMSDAVLWPAALVAFGVLVSLWRPTDRSRLAAGTRAALAAALVLAGTVLFVVAATEGGGGSSLVATSSLVLTLALVVGPWVWRLARERDAERLERIRMQERVEMATHVHDSVLQTLALVQRSADDPRRVAGLARRQERELRSWLYGGREAASEGSLRGALEETLADVEEMHGVRVDLVQTGDAPLDERLDALVLAVREAVANAAVHADVGEVSVFVEAGGDGVTAFVRDRGTGFDPESVPPDRRGLAESIEARIVRQGGIALVRSVPGEGTEIELRLPSEGS
jgi:signal transduction histidine kinase